MQLNRFTDLGLRVLIYLTQPPRPTPFTISEMADELMVSHNHLVKVVHFLGQHGWLATVRGKGGGLELARPPQRIGVGAVAVVAHQRAFIPLRMVVLVRRKSVVNEKGYALLQARRQAPHEPLRGQADFAAVMVGQWQGRDGREQLSRCRPRCSGPCRTISWTTSPSRK